MATHSGHSLGELRLAEFCAAVELVKPNVATGRDNIQGTILRLFLEEVMVLLYSAVVERLAGREDSHVKDWAEFDVCFVPRKGDLSFLGRWRLDLSGPHLVQTVRGMHVESS